MNPDPASLENLHDIITAPPAPWWPPAPAWFWVLGFAALTVLVWLVRAMLRWQRNRYRREALAELEQHGTPAAVAELWKRVALSAWPRAEVASLNGRAWQAFLERTGGPASAQAAAALEAAAYDPRQPMDTAALREAVESVRHWIRHHRREPC